MRNRVRPGRPGRYKAIALAVLVHLAIIGLLVVSFRWSSDSTRPAPRTIQATALKEQPSEKPPKKDEPSQREIDEAKKREEAKKRAEAEQKKREEAKRRAEAEKKRRAAEEAKKKEEAKRRAEAERKKREALAAEKRKEDEERKKREAEQSLRESLAAEEQARAEAARAARAATEAERYKALIIQKVERNWSKPPGSKGLECVLQVRVVPGGEVVAVKVVQSSGDAVFDNSVQNAVWKSTPLPLPDDPALFDYLREIEFTFRPSGG